MNIGESLKEHRISRNLSLMDIEKATGIRNGSLCRWEKGDVIPGINFCIQLAQYYGITLDELVGLTDNSWKDNNNIPKAINETTEENRFIEEYGELINDSNYIAMSKLYKAINSNLRALTLGYIIGVLQRNNVDTAAIIGF